MKLWREFSKGLIKENPIFRLVLGMCPTLAVTTSVENGIGMGLATSFVLLGSNTVVSLVRHLIPSKVRIPCYIVIIATFVIVVEMLMEAFVPVLFRELGIFIPLIVVNCLILGRAEAFASKNGLSSSLADALGMGLGFTGALAIVSWVREVLGRGLLLAILAPGGFILLGLLLALLNALLNRRARRRGRPLPAPPALDCRTCVLCGPRPCNQ